MSFIVIFLLQSVCIAITWWLTTDHNKRDFVFLVYGLFFATSCCTATNSPLMAAMRHFIAWFAAAAVCYRWKVLRYNMGVLSKIILWLIVASVVGTAWSSHPDIFLKIKWTNACFCFSSILMAATLSSEADLRKVLLSALPTALLIPICLQFFGIHDVNSVNARLMVNDMNQNLLGSYSCFSALLCVYAFLYLDKLTIFRFALVPFAMLSLKLLIQSGSRTSFAAFVLACVFVIGSAISSLKRLFLIGLPTFILLFGGLCYLWTHAESDLVTRLSTYSDVSARDTVWDEALYRIVHEKKWFGVGTIEQGWIMQRKEWMEQEITSGSMLNIYLDSVVSFGVVGVVLWLSFFVCFLVCCLKVAVRVRSPMKYLPISMCVLGLAHGFSESLAMKGNNPINLVFFLGVSILSAKCFVWDDEDWRSRLR